MWVRYVLQHWLFFKKFAGQVKTEYHDGMQSSNNNEHYTMD